MHRIAALALLLPLAAAPAARAQDSVPPGPGTVLRLSETAEVTRAADEIRAMLRVEARDANAAAAQAAVNRAMAAALEAARAVPGVVAATGGYRSWRETQPTPRWLSTQTLNLRGPDPAGMLELVGQLQARGLAMDNLSFVLTRDATRAAREEATSQAVDAIRRRAEALARQLNLRVERLAELRVESDETAPPRPMLAMARAAPAPAPAPPVAQADDMVVSATVSVTAVLAP